MNQSNPMQKQTISHQWIEGIKNNRRSSYNDKVEDWTSKADTSTMTPKQWSLHDKLLEKILSKYT